MSSYAPLKFLKWKPDLEQWTERVSGAVTTIQWYKAWEFCWTEQVRDHAPRRYRCCLDIISHLAAIRTYTSLGGRPYADKMTQTTCTRLWHVLMFDILSILGGLKSSTQAISRVVRVVINLNLFIFITLLPNLEKITSSENQKITWIKSYKIPAAACYDDQAKSKQAFFNSSKLTAFSGEIFVRIHWVELLELKKKIRGENLKMEYRIVSDQRCGVLPLAVPWHQKDRRRLRRHTRGLDMDLMLFKK